MMAGCIHNSGPIEAALKTALETGSFDTGTFDNVTEEAYYLVHPLRGSLLFRAIEQASYDDSKLGEMDQVLGLLRELDPDDAWAASFASYEYHGTNTIHAFHFAASLGNVEVLRRLKAYYSDTVINLRSTITRSASKDVSHSNNGGGLAVIRSMSIDIEHYSPLLGAVYMSRTEAAIWLLENNADPNLPNVDGQTAIHILAKNGMPGEDVWRQEEATERLTTKLVECMADLGAKTGSAGHLQAWQCGMTALQLAASKKSSYPKHMIYLLAESFQKPEVGEPLQDLTLISRVNPAAAESLTSTVRSNRTVRKQLLLEVHGGSESDHVSKLAEVFRTAPSVAADILEMLTFRPQVKSLQKNPLPRFAWLENRRLVCAYQPDVYLPKSTSQTFSPSIPGVAIPPMPIWDYREPPIPWHAKFQSVEKDRFDGSKTYDVEVKVVHLPNVLDFRIAHELYSLPAQPRCLAILGRMPVQAIVARLWDTVRAAHGLDMGLEVLVLVLLMLLGFSPLEEESPAADSYIVSAVFAKALFDFVNMMATAHCLHWHSRTSWCAHFCNFGVLSEVMCCIVLALLAGPADMSGRVLGGDAVPGRWRVLVASNIFMRFLCLLRLLRSQQGIGELLIAVQRSVPKTLHMILLMTLVFANFACIFLTLKDADKTPEYILLYLWLGMVFGEGDGIENISGFDTDEQTFTGGGSTLVIQASIVFMVIASFLVAVVLMNLLIAIYSNYYEEMVQLAPFFFQKMRARDCAFYMLRPSMPLRLSSWSSGGRVKWLRRCAHLVTVLLFLLWLLLQERTHCGVILGAFLACVLLLLQATLLLDNSLVAGDCRRHYLWVCYRTDFDEVISESGGASQRYLRSELATLRGMEDIFHQLAALSDAVQRLTADEQPVVARRSSVRRASTAPEVAN